MSDQPPKTINPFAKSMLIVSAILANVGFITAPDQAARDLVIVAALLLIAAGVWR
jgi:hypothetical protein